MTVLGFLRHPARGEPRAPYLACSLNEPRPRFERGTSALRVRRIFRLSYRGMI
jgi:hypothetical protein